jgi:excisionase family DNA binding protein
LDYIKVKTTSTNIDRVERIVEMRNSGHTYDEIGIKFGLSRERIRQLYMNRHGNNNYVNTPKPSPWLKTGEVAHLLNVHVGTVRRWADQDVIKSYRIGPRGDRRFRRKDVDHLFREGIMPKS